MPKHGSTKDKIVRLISQGENTLSGISRKLSLAPSTVSKHIHDLELDGKISQVNSEHIKKWKYYQVNEDAGNRGGMVADGHSNQLPSFAGKAIIPAVAAILVIAALFYYYSQQASVSVPISITDPPQVPGGTQALYINYSSLSVHLGYEGRQSVATINSSGRIDLMSIINVSQVIGTADIKQNSTIEAVSFNITSASIEIGNTTYPVTVMNRNMLAVPENRAVVNSSSGILLDFSPVVVPFYTGNATGFAMLPSIRAIMTIRSRMGGNVQGGVVQVQQQYRQIFTDANVSISNVSLSPSGNGTSFSVAVSNNGPNPITVFGVLVRGVRMDYGPGGSQVQNDSYYVQSGGSTLTINASELYRISDGNESNGMVVIRLHRPVSNISIIGIGPQPGYVGGLTGFNEASPAAGVMGFFVESNGTLVPAMPGAERIESGAAIPGYSIAAHSSATLHFNGVIGMPGMRPNLTGGGGYGVIVATSRGVAAANFS